MKQDKGITVIALILIVVVIGVVVAILWNNAGEYVNKQKDEDIKSTMLAIQSVKTNIQNKNIVDKDTNPLVGTKLNLENNETEYEISEEFKQELLSLENAELYILNQEELNNCGIKDVEINNTKFYVVDYNSEEVLYSLGIDGKYKLSEM